MLHQHLRVDAFPRVGLDARIANLSARHAPYRHHIPYLEDPTMRDDLDPAAQSDDRRSKRAIDLDNYVPAVLTHLAIKLSGGAAAIYRRKFGIGITDWRIMALLAGEPWMTAGRVTELYGYDKAAVSRTLSSMLAKGLIETRFHGKNRRRQHIALTSDGLKMHDAVVEIARSREAQLISGLTEEERGAVLRLLTLMSAEIPKLSGE